RANLDGPESGTGYCRSIPDVCKGRDGRELRLPLLPGNRWTSLGQCTGVGRLLLSDWDRPQVPRAHPAIRPGKLALRRQPRLESISTGVTVCDECQDSSNRGPAA